MNYVVQTPTGKITDPLIYKFDSRVGSTYTELVAISGIKEYKVTRNKLWKEAKRNMSGTLNAVFIGIFPKLEVKIKVTTATYLKTLIGLFDTPYLNLKWFDPLTESYKHGTFYMNDYSNELISKIGLITSHTDVVVSPDPDGTTNVTPVYEQFYKEFDIHFIPVVKGGNDV